MPDPKESPIWKNRLHPFKRNSQSTPRFDFKSALGPVITIFLKTILCVNPENIKQKKTRLTQLEQISWDAVLEISKDSIGDDHSIITDDLAFKYNLACFYVKSIEISEQLLSEDLKPLIVSCLRQNASTQTQPNLTEIILKFILELEAHKSIYYSTQNLDQVLDSSQHLFGHESVQTHKNLSEYLISLNCQSIRIGNHESKVFNEIFSAMSKQVVYNFGHLELSKRRFSILNLTNLCLALIRQLIQQETTRTDTSTVTNLLRSSREASNHLPYLTRTRPRKTPPSPSNYSSISNETDGFRADILIDNPSPFKPVPPTRQLNPTCPPDEDLASVRLPEGLASSRAIDFEEAHHRAVGPGSSMQGTFCKKLEEMVQRNPEIFRKASGASIKNNSPLQVAQSLRAPDRPQKGLVDATAFSSPIKDTHQCLHKSNSSGAQQDQSPPPQDLNPPVLPENPSEKAPATPLQSPSGFCLIDPQLDATPIRFGSFTVDVQNSLLQDQNSLAVKSPVAEAPKSPSAPDHWESTKGRTETVIKDTHRCLYENNSSAAQEKNSSGTQKNQSPPPPDPNSPALPENPLEKSPAAPPQPRHNFRLIDPQPDAIQISFESFPTDGQNSIIAQYQDSLAVTDPIAQAPHSSDVQHHRDLQNDMTETDLPLAPNLKRSSSNQQKGFRRTTSGFLSSISEEITSASRQTPHSPPLRKTRIVIKPPTINHSEFPPLREKKRAEHDATTVNRAQSSDDQLEADPCPIATSSGHCHENIKVSQNQRSRSNSADSQGSESNEDQLDHLCSGEKKHKSTSRKPIPSPKRKRKSSEDHSSVQKRQESTSPNPTPVRKRKRMSSEDAMVEHKQRPSKKKSANHGRDARKRPAKFGRSFWTFEEEKLLIKEVKRHYHFKNCMARIIARHGPNGQISKTFSHRTSVDLKDKAINLSTRWHTNGIKVDEKCKRAFSRFPAKVQIKYESETETDESPKKSTTNEYDEERGVEPSNDKQTSDSPERSIIPPLG